MIELLIVIKVDNKTMDIRNQIERLLEASTHINLVLLSEERLNLNLGEQRYELEPFNQQQRAVVFFKLIDNYLKLKSDIK